MQLSELTTILRTRGLSNRYKANLTLIYNLRIDFAIFELESVSQTRDQFHLIPYLKLDINWHKTALV